VELTELLWDQSVRGFLYPVIPFLPTLCYLSVFKLYRLDFDIEGRLEKNDFVMFCQDPKLEL